MMLCALALSYEPTICGVCRFQLSATKWLLVRANGSWSARLRGSRRNRRLSKDYELKVQTSEADGILDVI